MSKRCQTSGQLNFFWKEMKALNLKNLAETNFVQD